MLLWIFAGTGIGICGVLVWSALPLVTGQAAKLNRKPSTAAATDEEEGDGVKFGVMTVVGAIPLVNWSVSISFLLDYWHLNGTGSKLLHQVVLQ